MHNTSNASKHRMSEDDGQHDMYLNTPFSTIDLHVSKTA